MKGVIGTDNVDAQIGDGLPGRGRARPAARRDRRLRPRRRDRAARPRPRRGAAGPPPARAPRRGRSSACRSSTSRRSRTGCREHATVVAALACRARSSAPTALELIAERPRRSTRVRSSSCSAARRWPSRRRSRSRAARRLRDLPDVRFLSALRRGNVHGAIDSGLVPGFLPGRVTLDAGREWFEPSVGRRRSRARKGLDAQGILEARGRGQDRGAGDPRLRSGRRLPRRRSRRARIAGVKQMIAIGGVPHRHVHGRAGLRVVPQGTGHNASLPWAIAGTSCCAPTALRDVAIDPAPPRRGSAPACCGARLSPRCAARSDRTRRLVRRRRRRRLPLGGGFTWFARSRAGRRQPRHRDRTGDRRR